MKLTHTTNRSMEYRRSRTSCELRILTKTVTKVNVTRKSHKRIRGRAWTSVFVLILRLALMIVKELIGSGKCLKIGPFAGAISYANQTG